MKLLSHTGDMRERITDWYLITILFLFPLFPGFSGYADITFAKYAFYLTATGLWVAALIVLTRRERRALPEWSAPQCAAAAFLAVCALSLLFSPWKTESLQGAGRFDGFVTLAFYVLSFLGVSAFSRPRLIHAAALAAGCFLCCTVGVLQLCGFNPLRLFPAGVGFYDSGLLYSGVYLGTIGNTNILDAVLCLALPLCLTLYIQGFSPLFLLPLPPACFCLVRAGGTGAALAFLVFAMLAAPLLLTDLGRLRRAARALALILAVCALGLSFAPEYDHRSLTLRFILSRGSLMCAAAAVALFCASCVPVRASPGKHALRAVFLLLDAAGIIAGLLALWFWQGDSGPVYELSRTLHGSAEDSFGSSRVLIWRNSLALFSERPLLGGGPGTLALRLNIDFSRFVPETGETLTAYVDNAHNIYLGLLVNCGAAGLISYLSLLLLSGKAAMRARSRPLYAALALGVLCAAVHGLFGLGLCISEPLFWTLLGLCCGRDRNEDAT